MVNFAIFLAFVAAFVAIYALWLRPWMRTRLWAQGFFVLIEPVEILFWRKSETILWNRLLMLMGALPPILEQLEKLNIPALQGLVPEKYQGWWTLTFTVIGIIGEYQRRDTTKPLEVVALPVDMPPAVAAAVARAEVANATVVAAVAVAVEKGTV
jgi:hypothetical protein